MKHSITDGDVFEFDGLRFRVEHRYDDHMITPWEEHDGHGIVSEWTSRAKRPGERVLVNDGSSQRYYDFQETIGIALRDGWDTSTRDKNKPATKRQIAAAAVEADFERMRAWCNDEWNFIGVIVTLLDVDGNPVQRGEAQASVWGIESDSGEEYLTETARELAEEIAAHFKDQDAIEIKIRTASNH